MRHPFLPVLLLVGALGACSGGFYDASEFAAVSLKERTAEAKDASSSDPADPTMPADPVDAETAAAKTDVAAAEADATDMKADDAKAAAADAAASPTAAAGETPGTPAKAEAEVAAAASSDAAAEKAEATPATSEPAAVAASGPAAEAKPATEAAKAVAAAQNTAITDAPAEALPDDDEPEAIAFQRPHRREKMDSLPGVEWPEGIILVSRNPDEDAGSFFRNGPVHPFAGRIAGVPRTAVVAPNGLLLAHSSIQVGCLKPGLMSLVRRAEGHFRKRVVITSGYRSPPHNRRVRGARNSQHMYCSAVDLYMPGVDRDALARYFFSQPDRGGIGLYCHTQSIHIDTGSRRAWRWPCYKRSS